MGDEEYCLTLAVACLSPTVQGLPIAIDGDLSDWGLTPSMSDWDPADWHDGTGNEYNADGYYEIYDLKAMYFANDAQKFYFAAVGAPSFGPGDASNGFTGNELDDPGGDLILDMDGNMSVSTHGVVSKVDHAVRVTSGSVTHVGDILQLAPYAPLSGGSRHTDTWVDTTLKYWDGEGWQGSPWLAFAGNDAGEATVAYNGGVLEVAIDRSLFPGIGTGDKIGMHMTVYCGNDSINLKATVNDTVVPPGPPEVVVPVPGALVLAGLGTGLVGCLRRRRKVV